MLPVELWVLILVRASDFSAEILDKSLKTLCSLNKGLFFQRFVLFNVLFNRFETQKATFAATWKAPSFSANVYLRRSLLRFGSVVDAQVDLNKLTTKFSVDGAVLRFKSLHKLDQSIITRALFKRIVDENWLHLARVIVTWLGNEKRELSESIIDGNIMLGVVAAGSFELVKLVLSESASHPPPWLAQFSLPDDCISTICDLGSNDAGVESKPIDIPPDSGAAVYFHSKVLDIAACQQDSRIISHFLKYTLASPSLHERIIEKAPDALLLSCERGLIDVSRILFGLCRHVHPGTLISCVVSQRVEILELLIDDVGILKCLLDASPTPPPGAVSFSIDSRSFKCLKLLLSCSACPVTATDVLFATKFNVNNDRRVIGLMGLEGQEPLDAQSPEFSVLDMVLAACPSDVASEALNMAIHEGDPEVFNNLLNTELAEATESTFTSAVFLNNRNALVSLIINQQAKDKKLAESLVNDGTLPTLDSLHIDAATISSTTLAHTTVTPTPPQIPTNKLFQVALTCAIDTENIPLLAAILGSTTATPTTSDLFIAARKQRTTIARFLINENPTLAHAPFDLAVRQRNIHVLETLITCGAVPSLLTVTCAIEMGHVDVLEVLMKGLEPAGGRGSTHGSSRLKYNDEQLSVVLGSAICTGNQRIAQTVILSGAFTPTHAHLYLAAKRGMVGSVKLMLEYQKILKRVSTGGGEQVDSSGQSSLDLAVREGNILAVTVLVTAGINVGPYALASAVESGRVELLLALSGGGAVVDPADIFPDTESRVPAVVVALAIQQGSLLMLRTLLNSFGVKVLPVLLLMGVRTGDLALVKTLLAHFNGPIGKDILDVAFSVDFDVAEALIQHVLERNRA
ncbi:UNVERIFIED_CONTAM: hypothetical protein HDU68_000755 [Siphonaria sp. JEL0065]|nr:hypothetical protein HDU68_000755 [Siphonaria sp. JEL0065]